MLTSQKIIDTIVMKITVIRVMINGVVGYLKTPEPSCFDQTLAQSPLDAFNFQCDCAITMKKMIDRATSSLVVPGDALWAKSGLRIDKLPELVTFELQLIELTVMNAREVRQ